MSKKKKKPYLGPLLLAWCDQCNVPLVKRVRCARCGAKTRSVPVTPPGDARPAFDADRNQILATISRQFGSRVAQKFLPADKIVLLNAIPDIDCCEEIIVDGQIVGLHRFHIDTLSWEFIPKMEGARRLVELTESKQVIIEDSAVPFIVKGANLLRPGVLTADDSIRSGDIVIGVTERREAVFVGTAQMTGLEMQKKARGIAVKKRYNAEACTSQLLPAGQSWTTVLESNVEILHELESEAITFVENTTQKYHRPFVVAFSGGKDSLVVLLLVKKALPDQSYHIIFINTGIEFPETVDNVYSTVTHYGLQNQLLVKNVEKNQFFRVLQLYGLVARDYRVCCKTVKLGPTSQLIEEHFPDGCLSFIGQRRYESHRRSASRRIWKNPWVPKQVGASPIHNWTALMIWLYIFREKAPYNPLYEAGFERIGCMFCPASTMNELTIIADQFPSEWQRWESHAEGIAKRQGMTKEWLKHGFWRWKNHPPKIQELAHQMNIDLQSHSVDKEGETLSFALEIDDEHDNKMIRGRFNKPIDILQATAFLPALGNVIVDLERRMIEVTIPKKESKMKAFLFESGYFSFSGPATNKIARRFARTVLRGVLCTGCGTCHSLCANEAISIKANQARIIEEKCSQCGECLRGKCPSLYAY
ncbi:MAG: phosphoadenosine phosphosulfate reductase family protein [Promethearchaeota archaeon]